MGFYSGAWVDALEDAKNLYRRHVHMTDPFPERNSKTLQDAHDCLLEAISQCTKIVLGQRLLTTVSVISDCVCVTS